ncbi:hypothetical protein ERO13_D01G158350v2, partial [Gossypium hirsutum]
NKENGLGSFVPEDIKTMIRIKEEMKKIPNMEIPLDSDYLIIETGGSIEGWGAALYKKDNKYASKSSKKLCRYNSGKFKEKGIVSGIDAEVLAPRYALESFELFIIGGECFTLRTDCISIVKYFANMKETK